YIIRLHIFRHITQILLALRQQGGVEFRQSDEKSDCASDAQWLCGVAYRECYSQRWPAGTGTAGRVSGRAVPKNDIRIVHNRHI
ncbi:MAG: hypothetical protein IKP47_02165, partial [Ruminococcus sp.]|nr:hypothetical protein [Ruminococcus sp.]